MSSSFVELLPEKLNDAISALLCSKLEFILNQRKPGHCMRVSDLNDDIIESVCTELCKRFPTYNIFILDKNGDRQENNRVTATKLVELRNQDEERGLRPPLLVFIPNNLRTSAEDSFGIATFEELYFSNIYDELLEILLKRVPKPLIGPLKQTYSILKEENWIINDSVSQVRHILTALENGIDGETIGAALYELGLVPDFKLFEDTSVVISKIRRNLECVSKLIESYKSVRGRIIDLGLNNQTISAKLADFFTLYDVYEPEKWMRRISLEKGWWDISFDKWSFLQELSFEKIDLSVLETDLPTIKEEDQNEALSGLVGQQVLVPNERRKMNVVFEVKPHPGKVNGLDHFTVQIMSRATGPIGKTKKVKVWKVNRVHCTVNLTKLNKIEFEDGWHYIRVLPWTVEGDPIPFFNDHDTNADSHSANESEPFYVLPDGDIEEDPPQRAIPFEKSLEHAKFKLQLIALGDNRSPLDIQCTDMNWAEGNKKQKTAKQGIINLKFGREGTIQIPVSKTLKDIEQRILAKPEHPSGWRMQINLDKPEPPSEKALNLSFSSAEQSFLSARSDLFNAIKQGSSDLICQAFSFEDNKPLCEAYAESYIDLINDLMEKVKRSSESNQQVVLKELKSILAVDTVHVVTTDYQGKNRAAVLVSPTHPLKIIWLLNWVELGRKWVNDLMNTGKDFISSIKMSLIDGIQAVNFPVGIPIEDGRVFVPVDNLNPFWGLYAPINEDDTRSLMSEICSALGISEPATAGGEISGATIADKIERYILQHPYVRELSINVFNPGSGVLISDALTELQKRSAYKNLRYDIRLFSANSESPVLGESLETMINPGSIVQHEVAEVFSLSTGNHLYSKMNLAKHHINEFNTEPDKYNAHLSILLDFFPAKEFSVASVESSIIPFHGLIQDYETKFFDDNSGTFWQKSPIVGNTNTEHNLLTTLSDRICYAISTVATSGANLEAVPMITLGLTVKDRKLIYQIHQISDWVFTIDKNMGIEFLDHGGRKNRPDYLIDYVPGSRSHTTYNLIVSSRSTDELKAMLKPVLQQQGLNTDGKQAVSILTHLRSLSGQLALKLISASTQQKEALGLALARLYLEYQGALSNQIIVPLDAHVDLYRTSSKSDTEDTLSLQRTDLALFDLNLEKRVITCNLVEVKCYTNVGDFSAYNQLKEKVSQQINQSELILQRHFDPAIRSPDRPDRLLKSREFSVLLKFYLERSIRYKIFGPDATEEARFFLKSIEQGFSLQFRRSALIFDFEKTGTDAPDNEVGIEFHRIGRDLIKSLLDKCSESISEDNLDEPPQDEFVSLSDLSIPQVPKLDSAAFLAPSRERITSSNLDQESTGKISQENHKTYEEDEEFKLDLVAEKKKSKEKSGKSVELEEDVNIEDTPVDEQKPSRDYKTISDKQNEKPEGKSLKDYINVDKQKLNNVPYDAILGINSKSPQYGILGEISNRKVALDLNHTHTISLFGVQGGGKSYTLGTIIEMATMPIESISVLPSPLATVIFHYSPTQDYAPEFTTMNQPNSIEDEISTLQERYSGNPKALEDILILTPSDKVDERRAEFPELEVHPIAFSASELKASHWKFLMGAIGSQSMYMRQINHIMRQLRNNLTLEGLQNGIEESNLSDHLKDLALTRLQFAREYIDDSQELQKLIRPGRLIIVDLRDEYIEKDEALGLFVVMLQILSEATLDGKAFNKLVVFDEAHKYIENADLVTGLIEVVREMRHKGTSILVASQDPPSVPISIIELSTQIIMHKFNSPAWLKHIQKANAALSELTSSKMSQLGTGEAYVWSSKASESSFTSGAVKVKCRPRVTQHGGGTKTAING